MECEPGVWFRISMGGDHRDTLTYTHSPCHRITSLAQTPIWRDERLRSARRLMTDEMCYRLSCKGHRLCNLGSDLR